MSNRARKGDKDWLMQQELPLYVEPDKTDPFGRMYHVIGTDHDFVALDYHVFPDLSVQRHALINSRTGGFIQNLREPIRVPASDALEQAQQLVDAALEWAAANGMGPAQTPMLWLGSQAEGRCFIRSLAREVDPGFDPRHNLPEARRVVARLLGS